MLECFVSGCPLQREISIGLDKLGEGIFEFMGGKTKLSQIDNIKLASECRGLFFYEVEKVFRQL